jgi:hypothetical protein
MQDLIYVAATLGLFVVAATFVWACDRIVGDDEERLAEEGPDEHELEREAERAAA